MGSIIKMSDRIKIIIEEAKMEIEKFANEPMYDSDLICSEINVMDFKKRFASKLNGIAENISPKGGK
jgi:hypothetical protein